jgi:hypothetical protein
MNCVRCNLELFPHPIDRIDRVWGEATCYLNGSHHKDDGVTLHPAHLTVTDLAYRIVATANA